MGFVRCILMRGTLYSAFILYDAALPFISHYNAFLCFFFRMMQLGVFEKLERADERSAELYRLTRSFEVWRIGQPLSASIDVSIDYSTIFHSSPF